MILWFESGCRNNFDIGCNLYGNDSKGRECKFGAVLGTSNPFLGARVGNVFGKGEEKQRQKQKENKKEKQRQKKRQKAKGKRRIRVFLRYFSGRNVPITLPLTTVKKRFFSTTLISGNSTSSIFVRRAGSSASGIVESSRIIRVAAAVPSKR